MLKVILVIMVLFLSACGKSIEGTYTDAMGLSSYTFSSGGKAYVGMMGIESEMTYEVDGKRVKLMTPQGNMVLQLMEDGTLQGPMGIVYSKKK